MNFKKLKPREKLIASGLAIVVVFSLYFKIIHEPFAKQVQSSKIKIKRAESQLNELKIKYPPVSIQQQKIKSLSLECDRLAEEISLIEKKLPSGRETSQLIGEFTRLAREAKLMSIRQKTAADGGYNRIYIEVKLNTSYPNAINYIGKVESISPFIRVEEVDINESTGKTIEEGGSPVRIVFSSLLGDSSIFEVLKASDQMEIPAVKRDILVSTAKPLVTLSEKEFKLEGVTYDETSPTAIVNGDVVRIDSEIKGYKVKKINESSIVLTNDIQDFVIKLNR